MLLRASLKAKHLHITVLFRGPFNEAEYLHISVAVGGPFKKRLPSNCSCCWGPFESLVLAHYSFCRGAFWKQSTYLWSPLLYIIWTNNKFFTKKGKFFRTTSQGGPKKRGDPRQVPRLPPLKHTTDCIQYTFFEPAQKEILNVNIASMTSQKWFHKGNFT